MILCFVLSLLLASASTAGIKWQVLENTFCDTDLTYIMYIYSMYYLAKTKTFGRS